MSARLEATATRAVAETTTTITDDVRPEEPGVPDDGAPHDDADEVAMIGELRARGETGFSRPPPSESEDSEAKTALPALDELVSRVPAEVRELLDELFRARFTAVRRMPARALKQPGMD